MVRWLHHLRALHWQDCVSWKNEQRNAEIHDGGERKDAEQDDTEGNV